MLFFRYNDKIIFDLSSTGQIDYNIAFAANVYAEYNGSIVTSGETIVNPSVIIDSPLPGEGVVTVSSLIIHAVGGNTVTLKKAVGTKRLILFKASLSAGDTAIFSGNSWNVYDASGKLKVTTATGGGGGGADGGNILAAGTQTADSTATVVFQNGNGMTFGMDSNTITASYTVPNTTQFQHSSLMSNYLGLTYTSHTHSQYLNLSQSSLLQHTSLMSNYLGTGYTTHTHSQYLNTSQSSLFQNTSLMSDYLGTTYTSHTHTQLAQAISASNTSVTFETASFGNSNGLSFYITNGSVVGSYTVPVVSDFLNTSQSSLFQQTSLMSNYLGTDYTSHTHSQSVQTQNMVSINNSTGAIWFENGNGVTFGGTASTITASYTVPATTQLLQTSQSSLFQQTSQMSDYLGTAYTTHTHSQYVNTSVTSNFLTTQTVQPVAASASNGSFNFSTLKFAETNGVTFATSTDGIRASVQTDYVRNSNSSLFQQTSLMSNYLGTGYTTHTHSQYRASNDAIGLNTAQSNVTWTVNSNGVSLDARGYAGTGTSATNASVTLNSNGIAISIAAPGAANINLSAGTTSNNLTAFTLSNSNGVSFGLNGSVVTASHNGITSQTVQTQNMVSLLGSTGNISFANGNGITFGGNASTITASHNGLTSQSNQAVSASNGSFTFQTLSFADSNGVTFGTGTQGIFASVRTDYQSSNANYLTSQSNQAFSASGGSSAFQTLNFANSNGLTFSNSNGSVIASYTVPTLTNSSMTMQAGTQTLSSVSRVAFGDSNGITFGASTSNNGSITITASHNGITSQTVQTQNMVSILGSTGNISFANGNGITFGVNASTITASHNGLTSQSNQAFSASGGSSAFQTLNFANSNGITFSNSNGSIIASHNGLTAQSYQPMAFSGSNGSFTASTLSFGNLNGMSFYTSNGSIVASYTDAGAGGGISAVNFSAGTTSGNLTNIVFANSNGISFGLNGSTITASVNAGAGGGIALANSETTFSSGTAFLSAAGALTIASTTGQSLQFSVPGTSSLSATGALSISVNSNTISIGVPAPATMSGYNAYADLPLVAHQQGNGTLQFDPDWMPAMQFDRIAIPMAFTNASNSSGSQTVSYWFGIYTKNASSLSLLQSVSGSTAMTQSGTQGSYSLFSGMRLFTIGMTTTLPEGQYWLGFLSRTTSGGANASVSHIAASNINSNFVGLFGQSNNTTMQYTIGQGVYTATTSAMPSSVAFSQIRGSDSAGLRGAAIMFASNTI